MKSIKYFTIISLFFVFSICANYAQVVTTFITEKGLDGPDGFALDAAGNLYVANWGKKGNGSTVLKIDTAGNVTTSVSGLKSPDGLAFDKAGSLYISNYASGVISKVSPAGEITVFAQGLDHPSALAFDKTGNLYVSNHGKADGNTISKISPGGEVSTFASGFKGPVGLAFDSHQNLFVANFSSGIINKITTNGVVTILASIPNSPASYIQYLACDRDDNLYMPSYGLQKIFKITPSGIVTVFAGTGIKGNNDGELETAQFNGPNSIIISREGDMYISEFNTNRIRKIQGAVPAFN